MAKFRIVYFNPEMGKFQISQVYDGDRQRKAAMKDFYDSTYNNRASRVVPASGGAMWSDLIG